MKFLHLADLHLGKRMNDISLLPDQIHMLRQLHEIAKSEKADAVLIAGDVYQKSAPSAEAMEAFNDFITDLVSSGLKVFIISGNHDSEQRISYFSDLLCKSGVYASRAFDGTLQTVRLEDEFGPINVSLLPFVKPFQVRRFFPDECCDTYQQAIECVLRRSALNTAERNILLCHQFITGAETSDSEEHSVGGLDNIDCSVFDAFDYVALGHIHKAQKVGRETLRYSGSPLKYSFSEAGHKKSAVLVNCGKKGDIELSLIPLHPLHDLREISGHFAELLNAQYSEDYVGITLFDELVPPDAAVSLSTVFPNLMRLSVENSKTTGDILFSNDGSIEDKSISELFCDFYRLQNNDVSPTAEHLQLLEQVLKDLEVQRNEAD